MPEANESDKRTEHLHELITIYIDGRHEAPARARKDICIRRSGWIENALRYDDKGNQWVHIEGLDVKTSRALISYFQINSVPMRTLNKHDRQLLIEIFELHELKQEEANEEDWICHKDTDKEKMDNADSGGC